MVELHIVKTTSVISSPATTELFTVSSGLYVLVLWGHEKMGPCAQTGTVTGSTTEALGQGPQDLSGPCFVACVLVVRCRT